MNKYLISASLMAVMALTSCDNIDDVYQYGDEQADINWDDAAGRSTDALIEYFWDTDRHFFNSKSGEKDGNDWNYWPQAHAMDAVIDAYNRTGDAKYSALFDQWYEGIKQKSGGSYYNDFYDDEEWITLTMIRLYEVTKDAKYLNTAKDLWNDIKGGWNEEFGGGGLAWKHSMLYSKNACSNAPGSLIACRLYELEKNQEDLEWAVKIYSWTRDNLFNPATGAVYDGMDGRSGEINTVTLTYNQGTFLGSALRLYKFTGDANYLKDARRAANYAITKGCIDQSNNVLRNEGNGDGALFKGIFIRYFIELIAEPDLDPAFANKFTTFLNNNAVMAWTKGIADKRQILFGPSWTDGPLGATELNAQVSGATLMEAKARFDKNK